MTMSTNDDFSPLALPPNTTLEKFQDFINKSISIVGTDNITIVSGDAHFEKESYHDPSKTHDVSKVVWRSLYPY